MAEDKLLSITDLKKGDVLLSTGIGGVSHGIKFSTNSRYSHTALYIGGGNVIEAIDPLVKRWTLIEAMSDDILVSVYRMPSLTEGQAAMIITYAEKQLDKPYDISGALGAGATSVSAVSKFTKLGPPGIAAGLAFGIGADVKNRLNPEKAFFCSELVAFSYKNANVPLGSGPASTTPQDIVDSGKVEYIGDLLRAQKK